MNRGAKLIPTPVACSRGRRNRGTFLSRQFVAVFASFSCFVCVRSFHPIVIDLSKTEGVIIYGKATPCVINSAVDIVLGNVIAFMMDGRTGVLACWNVESL